MYYVPQLKAVPSDPDTKSDTTVESSHSGIMQNIIQDVIFRNRVYWLVDCETF